MSWFTQWLRYLYKAYRDGVFQNGNLVVVTVPIRILISERLSDDVVARIYYPDEGSCILIRKGLNEIEFDVAMRHELGHLYDWYAGGGRRVGSVKERETNAWAIAKALYYLMK